MSGPNLLRKLTCIFFLLQNEIKYLKYNFSVSIVASYLPLQINKMSLEVSLDNLVAENFYKKFNFNTVGRRRNYYKNGSDALLKEKKLTTK